MTAAKVNGVAFVRCGSGEPLLLIHGTGGSRSHWTPLLELLAPHRDLVPAGLWPKHDSWRCTAQLRSQHKLSRLFAPKPRQMPPEAATEMAETFARTRPSTRISPPPAGSVSETGAASAYPCGHSPMWANPQLVADSILEGSRERTQR